MEKTEEELALVKKELEELREEYHEYAYKVSHDLSAPFRQINGFAEILFERYSDNFDEKAEKHFRLILRGARTGENILSGLLEHSRLNTRGEEFSEISCNEIAEQVLKELSELISSSNAKIVYEKLPVIQADKKQIFQLFYHVIQNALIYQKPGNIPEVSIVAHSQPDCEEFCIEDNGIGIKEAHRKDIFKILTRDVVATEYPGMGMGLAIAKKIVRRHGGRIEADEKDGKTQIRFTIQKPK
ncbi:MAG: sensor histidine kinase [Methyloligellaceae bacterium]